MTGETLDLELIVLAAGKGTRMKSELPKVLHTLCGKSMLERVLSAAAALQPQKIVVVVGHQAQLLNDELERLKCLDTFAGIAIESVLQEEQLGTGQAAKIALAKISESAKRVLIIPADVPLMNSEVLKTFFRQSEAENSDVSVLTAEIDDAAGFGRIVRGASGGIERIVEHKDCTAEELKIGEFNTSFYMSRLDFLKEALAELKPNNAQGEFYLTDIVSFAVARGVKVSALKTDDLKSVSGCNSRYQLSMLEAQLREQINRNFMLEGVTLEDPQTTYIDEGVCVEPDCIIGAGTRLQGKTIVERGVYIEGNSLIRDSRIASESVIKFSSSIEESTIGEGCQVGPFARLRPGTILHNNVKVGNFVETKKAELHSGAKASHLTYLGDAEVGENSNIGAGTITCNYDGKNKFKTSIKERCFIGSNSALVAPVVIGPDAYVGAGSVINKDVPRDALAVARGQQRNVEGWTKRKKEKS